MKINQYFSNVIKALTGNKLENLQAPLFEELDDSATSNIVGGGPNDSWRKLTSRIPNAGW